MKANMTEIEVQNKLQDIVDRDRNDAIFHTVQGIIDVALGETLGVELDDDEYFTWRVVIGPIERDDFDPDARGPEPLLDKP